MLYKYISNIGIWDFTPHSLTTKYHIICTFTIPFICDHTKWHFSHFQLSATKYHIICTITIPFICDHTKWHFSHFQLSTVTWSIQDIIPPPFLYHWWSEFMQAFYSVDTLPLPKQFGNHQNQIHSPWRQHISSKYQKKCNALNDVKTHKTTTHIKKDHHHLKLCVHNFRT